MICAETKIFSVEALREFSTRVFLHLRCPKADAEQAADVLACADLRGIDSHGIARLHSYFEMLSEGGVNPKPDIEIVRSTLSTATVDGDNGLGLIVGPTANRIAMDLAEKAGSGWVSVCNTNHFGIAGYYVLKALERDLIGWAMTNSTKLVAPLWGAERMLGTNPIAIGFPGKQEPPIVIDMATSAAAYGKVEMARRKGDPIPSGWDFSIGYTNLAVSYMALERIADAESTLQRASERKLEIPDFFVLRYAIAFLKGDKAELDRVAAEAQEKPGVDDWMANSAGYVLAYTGHLREARKMSRRATDLARKGERRETEALYEADAAIREAQFGNISIARQRAVGALELSKSRDVEYEAAFTYALSGDSSRSQALTKDLARRFPEDTRVQFTYAPTLRALLALDHRQPSKAVELLQTASPYELGIPTEGGSEFLLGAGNLYPTYVRGLAYLAAHQGAEAVAEFQKILNHHGIVICDPVGALAQLQLGRSYGLLGDKTNAKSAYQDFLTLWKGADPGIPILEQAKSEYARLQ
jgi:tetratricopeptide (TPR) repeat protein